MKKILFYIILSMLIIPLNAFADNISDIKTVFNNYVNDANNYSKDLPSYYTDNATIIRVVNRKQGGKKSIVIPYDRYVKELTGRSAIARAVNYKNRYVNIKITSYKDGYKLSAIRIPRNDKSGLPCHFVFVNQNGHWKIKEESMTTNVQTFLSAK